MNKMQRGSRFQVNRQEAEYNHARTKCKKKKKKGSGSTAPIPPLLAGQFGVEATQADGESLEGRERVAVVHGEHVLGHLTELEDDLVLVLRSRL